MDIDEAIRFLDPKTTAKAIGEVEYYGGFNGQRKAIEKVNESCDIAVLIMNTYKQIEYFMDEASKKGDLSKENMEVLLYYIQNSINLASQQIEIIDDLYNEKKSEQEEDPER